MGDVKKRKLDEIGNAQSLPNLNDAAPHSTVDELRALLDLLAKPQLVDLLARAGSQYPSIAEEILSVASADPALRKLFVRGLAWNTTSETLCAAFQVHGEIEEGAVINDKITGKSRGYGFITYKDMKSAQRALQAPSKIIDGRLAVCNLASEGLSSGSNSTTPDLPRRKLYIGGLSPDTSSEMLLSFFGRHGEIEEGSVAYDKDTNKSRGFGFVTYKTAEAAKKALSDPEKILGGRHITVKLADNYKGKVAQPQQLSATAIPVAGNMAPGYQQTGAGDPMGYHSYSQPVPAYPTPAYPTPAYTSPPAAPPYLGQPQYPYPQYAAVKLETPGPQTGLGGYPYYMPKH